jgi:hypothetical protein
MLQRLEMRTKFESGNLKRRDLPMGLGVGGRIVLSRDRLQGLGGEADYLPAYARASP